MSYYDPFYWRRGFWPYQQTRIPRFYGTGDPLLQLGVSRYQRPFLTLPAYYGHYKPKSLYYFTAYGSPIIWR